MLANLFDEYLFILMGIIPQDPNKLLATNPPVPVGVSLVEQFLEVLVRHSSWALLC